MEFDTRLDIRESIAYPKRWQPKANPRVPFAKYPHMPTIPHRDKEGKLTGKANVPIYDAMKQPIIWATAREETEWLLNHPEEAKLIAEAKAAEKTPNYGTEHQLSASQDENKRLKAERDSAEKTAQLAMDELEAAKAELAALRAKKAGEGPASDQPAKLDMRTKAGREAARAAQGQE